MAIDEAALNEALHFDHEQEVTRISERIRALLRQHIRRRGVVVALSGGIDSSVSAALCVKALGPKKVFGLLLPELESSSSSGDRGQLLAEHLGIDYLLHDIAPALEAIGCYKWRDEAFKRVFPDYGPGWKSKITIAGGLQGRFNHYRLVVQSPNGELHEKPLELKEYLTIVAATNYKQRTRKSVEYFHADRLNYAVVGTPNRVEYDQGFFVKNGDGSADLKPIAHLYKSQVYALARHLGLPEEIRNAEPTTDTYSLAQGQDEFYYALPYREMDLALWSYNQGKPASELARILEISETQAEFIYRDIEKKRGTTGIQHWTGILMERVDGPVPKPEEPDPA